MMDEQDLLKMLILKWVYKLEGEVDQMEMIQILSFIYDTTDISDAIFHLHTCGLVFLTNLTDDEPEFDEDGTWISPVPELKKTGYGSLVATLRTKYIEATFKNHLHEDPSI